jgi:hypothetical protein
MVEAVESAEHDVFLSHTWSDCVEVDRLHRLLKAAGLRVFRDTGMAKFDAITAGLAEALDRSAVLLAFYSERYPTRYACQWELTRAFITAQRHGDPRRRILVVNPGPANADHVEPIELNDEGFHPWPPPDGDRAFVMSVKAKVEATGRSALGPPPAHEMLGAGERFSRPRRFVGRYPQMWRVHSGLHAATARAVKAPDSPAMVLVTGLSGWGKSELAAQYAYLFGSAYPGGAVWVDLGGQPGASGHYAMRVREEARTLGLRLDGLDLDAMRHRLARHFDAAGRDVLWIVDDVPPGLSAADLGRLMIPSHRVHTVLTARASPSGWLGSTVALEGLTAVEAEALFQLRWPDIDSDDRTAIAKINDRVGGNPTILTAAVERLAAAQGTSAARRLADTDALTGPVVDMLRHVVRDRGQVAQLVLGFAAALAPVDFGADVVVAGLAERLPDADLAVADALRELAEHSLIRGSHRGRRSWSVHTLVGEAARDNLGEAFMDALARDAAEALIDRVRGDEVPTTLHQHARHVAAHPSVGREQRLRLLRAVLAALDAQGDVLAAYDAAAATAKLSEDADDELTAARLAVATKQPEQALLHARKVLDSDPDERREYRARFLAAMAHDIDGRYRLADAVFFEHPASQATTTGWMDPAEHHRVRLGFIAARRLRGRVRAAHDEAAALLSGLSQDHPLGFHRGPWPSTAVELARLRLLTGRIVEARALAEQVRARLVETGVPDHPDHQAAVRVLAEAHLEVAFTDGRAMPARWRDAAAQIGALHRESADHYGPDSLHSLELGVLHAWGLQSASAKEEALAVLDEIEPRLPVEHPLRYTAQFVRSRCHYHLGQHDLAREILADLLPRQRALLGEDHLDTRATQFQWLLLAFVHKQVSRSEALRTAKEIQRSQREHVGWRHDAYLMAATARVIFWGPPGVLGLALP